MHILAIAPKDDEKVIRVYAFLIVCAPYFRMDGLNV